MDGFVYVIKTNGSANTLVSVPAWDASQTLQQPRTHVCLPDSVRSFAVTLDGIYWTDGTLVKRNALGPTGVICTSAVTTENPAGTEMARGSDVRYVAANAKYLYWADGARVLGRRLDGSALTTDSTVDGAGPVGALRVDGDGVYWTSLTGDTAVLRHLPHESGTGPPQVVEATVPASTHISTNNTRVFFTKAGTKDQDLHGTLKQEAR